MFAYGQVKGKRYDRQQPIYVPEVEEEVDYKEMFRGKRKHPVMCDGEKFESVAACARAYEVQPSTLVDHLNRGTLFRGHVLCWDFREDDEQ